MKTKNDTLLSETHLDDCFNAARLLLDDPANILSNIMMSMGDGLSIQDRNLRIVYQNKFMIDIFGSHIGDYCYTIYEKRSSACQDCPILESYRTGQVTKALRVGIAKDGHSFRFENIASVLRNEKGEIIAGIELCRIVEERERALDELREALEKLKKTQVQLVRVEKLAGIGKLAAGMAHEINNPTAFILGNMSVMQEYVSDFFNYINAMEKLVAKDGNGDSRALEIKEEIRHIINSEDYCYLKDDLPKVVEESLNGLHRIKTIVSSLHAFASFGEIEMSIVDLNVEIESALLILDNEISEKVGVVKNLGSLPKIFANAHLLNQMFSNLIINAIQAIEADGIITITTEIKDKYIKIEISDNGVGIPPDNIHNIFNPFFTLREVGSGVGMGLSIVHSIIESHNGNIDVQSELGRGTTFTIRLPIVSLDDGNREQTTITQYPTN